MPLAKQVGFESGKENWIWEMTILYSSVLRGLLRPAGEGCLGAGRYCDLITALCVLPQMPPNEYFEILMLNVMVLGEGWGEGRHWNVMNLWSWGLMNGISALIKETPESSSSSSSRWGHSEKGPSGNLKVLTRHRLCWQHDSGLPSLQNSEKHISVVYKATQTMVWFVMMPKQIEIDLYLPLSICSSLLTSRLHW